MWHKKLKTGLLTLAYFTKGRRLSSMLISLKDIDKDMPNYHLFFLILHFDVIKIHPNMEENESVFFLIQTLCSEIPGLI